MIYDVIVTIHNSPNKTKGWGYFIEAENKQEAIEEALERAKSSANQKYSRYKKCTFTVDDKHVIEKPDW